MPPSGLAKHWLQHSQLCVLALWSKMGSSLKSLNLFVFFALFLTILILSLIKISAAIYRMLAVCPDKQMSIEL